MLTAKLNARENKILDKYIFHRSMNVLNSTKLSWNICKYFLLNLKTHISNNLFNLNHAANLIF